MNRRAIGWDIHRKFSQVSVREIRDDGELCVVERVRLNHEDRAHMEAWLKKQPPGTPVAIEATFGWPWIADLLEQFELSPKLTHAPAFRTLVKHRAKGDRCDSDRLAEFQLLGLLPESYLAPREVRHLRERTRFRMALSAIRIGLKNRLQAVLHREGILHPYSDLFGDQGRGFLEGLRLAESTDDVLTGYLQLLDDVSQRIAEVEAWMTKHLESNDDLKLLISLPGVGKILGHVIQAEVGQIERFPSRRHFTSYCGLAPISDDSADRHGRRHISPACNHALRWALIEAAGTVVRVKSKQMPKQVHLYDKLVRHGRTKGQARVAVARELAELVYVVWTKRAPFSATSPSRPGSKSICHSIVSHSQGANPREP